MTRSVADERLFVRFELIDKLFLQNPCPSGGRIEAESDGASGIETERSVNDFIAPA